MDNQSFSVKGFLYYIALEKNLMMKDPMLEQRYLMRCMLSEKEWLEKYYTIGKGILFGGLTKRFKAMNHIISMNNKC